MLQHAPTTTHPTAYFFVSTPPCELTLSDLHTAILHALSVREQYGLELLVSAIAASHTASQPFRLGALHPILKELERHELITRVYRAEPIEGELRAYYRLTQAGRRAAERA